MYALVDSNNFYVSCERVFNPKLRDVPVLVLSNNDGCVISRSNEVKEMGIRMGEPYFKIKKQLQENGVRVYSSNFPLYGNLSARVVSVLREFTSDLEVYSIDESFLKLDKNVIQGDTVTLEDYGRRIRAAVLKGVGIPSGVGIGPTKTLAKLANHLAKKHPDFKDIGVCDLSSMEEGTLNRYLQEFYVGDIWGIGRKSAPKLTEFGIDSAYKLKTCDPKIVRKRLKVVGERIVRELNGIDCLPLSLVRSPRKSIMCTRSFGTYVENLSGLEEAVTLYATRAAEKLREQGSTTSVVSVFIKTNHHKKEHKQYSRSQSTGLIEGIFSTPDIVQEALKGLKRIYQSGYKYAKAGVILYGIDNAVTKPVDLFDTDSEEVNRQKHRLMQAFDKINKKYGHNALFLASQGVKHSWRMKSEWLSPHYTTDWDEIPEAWI